MQLDKAELTGGLSGPIDLTSGQVKSIDLPAHLSGFSLIIPTNKDDIEEDDETLFLEAFGGDQFSSVEAIRGLGTITETSRLTITPLSELIFRFDAKEQAFSSSVAPFQVSVSNDELSGSDFTLEVRAGHKTLTIGTNSMEVDLWANDQQLSASKWLSLIDSQGHYAGLDSITGNNSSLETGISKFQAFINGYKNSGEAGYPQSVGQWSLQRGWFQQNLRPLGEPQNLNSKQALCKSQFYDYIELPN